MNKPQWRNKGLTMDEKTTWSSRITIKQIGRIQMLLGSSLRKADLPEVQVEKMLDKYGDDLAIHLVEIVKEFVDMSAHE